MLKNLFKKILLAYLVPKAIDYVEATPTDVDDKLLEKIIAIIKSI